MRSSSRSHSFHLFFHYCHTLLLFSRSSSSLNSKPQKFILLCCYLASIRCHCSQSLLNRKFHLSQHYFHEMRREVANLVEVVLTAIIWAIKNTKTYSFHHFYVLKVFVQQKFSQNKFSLAREFSANWMSRSQLELFILLGRGILKLMAISTIFISWQNIKEKENSSSRQWH